MFIHESRVTGRVRYPETSAEWQRIPIDENDFDIQSFSECFGYSYTLKHFTQ